ncbi:MAG: RsmB/NOP family class I SAM-dependent RNA methyltransferase [Rhodoferax sp.]|nr:RsmB/NOP family class I SAM-dependent RNA methyltransferase [Rhodoferax sp.]
MPPRALLDLATELLRSLLRFDAPADAVVSAFFRRQRALGPRERHTLAETAYAVLRRRLTLQHLAQGGRGAIERRLAILGWQGDAGFLRAALADDEREWLDRIAQVDRASLPARLRHELPAWIAEALQAGFGADFDALAASLLEPAPLDLRVNALATTREAAQAALAAAGIDAVPTPYSPWGLRVAGKPAIQRLPVFTGGQVEVQDEGSQLLALLVDAHRGEMVVDFCAGAGGKTLQLGAMMRSTGRLYAFDVSEKRLAKLKPRMARAGLSNVHPVLIAHEADAKVKRLAGKADRVLVDAPCTGLGTLRRNPDLKWRQSPAAVEEMVAKQGAILAAAARLVRPGGRLVYATCSLLAEENDGIVDAFLAAHPEFRTQSAQEVLAAQGVTLETGERLRLLPHEHDTDGFFAAVMERAKGA